MRVPRPSAGLLVAVVIWALPLAALVLLFGGEQINPDCHINHKVSAPYPPEFFPPGCSPMLPGPIPVIGTLPGVIGASLVLGIAWLAAFALLLAKTWRRDRRTFLRVVVAAGVVGAVVGTTGLTMKWQHGYPGKSGIAEAFGLGGGGAGLMALVLFLALATIAAERRERAAIAG
ncbi:MAG: hypothetical protein ACJ77B_04890 [Chloroflexota bacterium]